MPVVTLNQVLARAEAGSYAVGAFNVSSLDQAIAVLEAATVERSPVILQVIAGVTPYRDEDWWWRQLRSLAAEFEHVPVAVHLDHGRTVADCVRAIEAGFTSVMIDASRHPVTDEPATFEANVELTREAVAIARAAGVSAEGELGTIGAADGVAGTLAEIVYADPESAVRFVDQTGVDALAIAVGTHHGSVKFTDPAAGHRLRVGLVEQIKARLPHTHLVLHGSSSVPAELVASINRCGGAVSWSYGIDLGQKQAAIKAGIRKINQGTDSHLAWTAALRELLASRPAAVEPSAQLAAAMGAFQAIVQQRMKEFGSAGRA